MVRQSLSLTIFGENSATNNRYYGHTIYSKMENLYSERYACTKWKWVEHEMTMVLKNLEPEICNHVENITSIQNNDQLTEDSNF